MNRKQLPTSCHKSRSCASFATFAVFAAGLASADAQDGLYQTPQDLLRTLTNQVSGQVDGTIDVTPIEEYFANRPGVDGFWATFEACRSRMEERTRTLLNMQADESSPELTRRSNLGALALMNTMVAANAINLESWLPAGAQLRTYTVEMMVPETRTRTVIEDGVERTIEYTVMVPVREERTALRWQVPVGGPVEGPKDRFNATSETLSYVVIKSMPPGAVVSFRMDGDTTDTEVSTDADRWLTRGRYRFKMTLNGLEKSQGVTIDDIEEVVEETF